MPKSKILVGEFKLYRNVNDANLDRDQIQAVFGKVRELSLSVPNSGFAESISPPEALRSHIILSGAARYCWSLLPMPVLHLQASVLAWLLFRVLGYRRKVVLDNLRQSFPEKTESEIQRIAKGFYLNLAMW